MFGINLNPVLAVRAENREQSEMTSQLLFGEIFYIEQTVEKWSFICNKKDQYKGWVDSKMITPISELEYNKLSTQTPLQIFKPLVCCSMQTETLYLPAGSQIHLFEDGVFPASMNYSIPPDCLIKNIHPASGNLIISTARSFLNAPYLWGGKSILGMDCSGLVQLCFNICGIELPRDASQQVEHGETVEFLQESKAGDIAFFENKEGKIIHVGILENQSSIIHASGKVRIDKIDNIGIKPEGKAHSHFLRIIKRVIT